MRNADEVMGACGPRCTEAYKTKRHAPPGLLPASLMPSLLREPVRCDWEGLCSKLVLQVGEE